MDATAHSAELRLPARAELVGVARAFAASAARLAGLADERVEDVKIAVSEACATAVLADTAADDRRRIVIRATLEGREVRLEIMRPGQTTPEQAPPGLAEGTLGLMLIDALFPGASVEGAADGATLVRLSVALDPETAER